MQKLLAVIGMALVAPAAFAAPSHVTERHCGWLNNNTPANYSLIEKGVELRIAEQGGYQSAGMDNLPPVDPTQFEATNGNYGRSCACLDIEIDADASLVKYIAGGESLALASCYASEGGSAPAPAPAPKKPVPPRAPKNPAPAPSDPWRDPIGTPKAPKPAPAPRVPAPRNPSYPAPAPSEPSYPAPKDPGYGQKDPGYSPPQAPAVPAEIQIMMDYRGYNNYAFKYVSDFFHVISAAYLLPSSPTPNGACFMGDPQTAADLFGEMVNRMNYEQNRNVVPHVEVYFDGGDTLKPALHVEAQDERGVVFEWFPRIRQCDRWSTPEERQPYPN